jgi:glutamine amidotransferase
MPKIGIINYGVGNLKSVKNSLDFLGIPNKIISKPADIDACDKIILPGVGAFEPAMNKINTLGFAKAIKKYAADKKPILGICLGMQLLFDESEEYGSHPGLGLIKGKVLALNKKVKNLPLPLIGWNDITKEKIVKLLEGIETGESFYFVHSFYCKPLGASATLASANYGIKFDAIVQQGNIYGCQFHPEKSQAAGLKILENFYKLC